MTRWQPHPLRELRAAERMFAPRRARLRRLLRAVLLVAGFLVFAYLFGSALGDRLERVPGQGAVSPVALEEMKGGAR